MADIRDDEVKTALKLGECTLSEIPLGAGSFSKVFRVVHRVSAKHYAVKVMRIKDCDEQTRYQNRELKLLRKLKPYRNQNIIQYCEAWTSIHGNKQVLCIRMELCRESLGEHYILPSAAMPAKDVLELYKRVSPQIFNGLDAIHTLEWTHRDIHPGNILIGNPKPNSIQEIVIKIGDFGLAKPDSDIDPPSSKSKRFEKLSPSVGNPNYRAPELSTNSDYDNKVDLFSAGFVLANILCRYLKNTKLNEREDEICKIREGKCDGVLHKWLCERGEQSAIELLQNLLNEDPGERPTARKALESFPPLKEAVARVTVVTAIQDCSVTANEL